MILDTHAHLIFQFHSNNFCLNSLLIFFVQAMHSLIDHFTSIMWTFDCSSPQYRVKLKKLSVREYPIYRDTLNITEGESGVKRRVPKLLLECYMRQLQNELIASPDYGGLLGARHADTNDVIISDIMICSLATPQLHPMTDPKKMMCGCAICNTSEFKSRRPEKLKIIKDKVDNLRGGGKNE